MMSHKQETNEKANLIDKPDILKNWIRKLILVVAIAVFTFSAYQLYTIYFEYKQAKDEYAQLRDKVVLEEQGEQEEKDEKGKQTGYIKIVDFDKLKKINEDVVGWIQFETLPINYPLMQGEDNDYYLHHTFKRNQNSSASIFLDYQCNSKFEDQNTFIYGHNMKNRSMFGLLNSYKEKEFYNKNPYFWIYTPDANYRYHIFSCYVVRADGDSYQMKYLSNEDYQKYLTIIEGYGSYDTGVEVSAKDSIVTLSTCTSNPDNRFIVHAVRIETYQAE